MAQQARVMIIGFELAAYALNPKIKVIAPWREWDFVSRSDLMKYAKKTSNLC